MLLRQSNSCYDTQDLERILLVFDDGLNDRPYGGVVFYAGLGTEHPLTLILVLAGAPFLCRCWWAARLG